MKRIAIAVTPDDRAVGALVAIAIAGAAAEKGRRVTIVDHETDASTQPLRLWNTKREVTYSDSRISVSDPDSRVIAAYSLEIVAFTNTECFHKVVKNSQLVIFLISFLPDALHNFCRSFGQTFTNEFSTSYPDINVGDFEFMFYDMQENGYMPDSLEWDQLEDAFGNHKVKFIESLIDNPSYATSYSSGRTPFELVSTTTRDQAIEKINVLYDDITILLDYQETTNDDQDTEDY